MGKRPQCPRCGGPLSSPRGDEEAVCTRCLLLQGLSGGVDETRATTGPAADAGAPSTPDPVEIGPYRVIRRLGEGGMGVVYLARQEQPIRRTVALKLIKHDVSSKQLLARFEIERQSLELMDHPSIARVLDAGTTPDGTPYFVMEYVDGVPLTQYCNEHRLTIQERLRLLIRVCDAVQHAHIKGVIHRDLKPTNILVMSSDDGPLPKVIDFGIAKATGKRMLEWSLFTEMGRLIGTPEYMSPEQADTSLGDVDTRTDVYALGVILYELLVGRTPLDAASVREAGMLEMLRQIREVDPPTPSSRLSTLGEHGGSVADERATDPGRLLRQLRGEIDWITMRAVEKDRERRYGSARELAEDLGRLLADEPVQARPPTAAYVLGKFVRRHRAGVAAALVAVLALIVFSGVLARQARQIARERDRARTEAAASDQVAGLLVELFRSADPYGSAAREPTARDLLNAGADRITRELEGQPETLARMLAEMGWAYHGLGELERAERLLERSAELYDERLDAEQERVMQAKFYRAMVYKDRERHDDAERLFRELTAVREARLGAEHRNTLRSRVEVPEMFIDLGRYDEARVELEALHAAQTHALGADDPDTLATGVLLATVLSHTGERDRAAPYVDAALRGLQMPDAEYDEDRAVGLMRLGWVCLFLQRHEESEAVYRDVLEHRMRALGADHAQTQHTRAMLASILGTQGRHDEAAAIMREVLEARVRVLGEDHPETLFTRSLLGDSLVSAGRYAEAEEQLRIAIEGHARLGPEGFRSTRARVSLGTSLHLTGRSDEALAEFRRVLAYCDEQLFDRHPLCRDTMRRTAEILRSVGDDEAAAKLEARIEAAASS